MSANIYAFPSSMRAADVRAAALKINSMPIEDRGAFIRECVLDLADKLTAARLPEGIVREQVVSFQEAICRMMHSLHT